MGRRRTANHSLTVALCVSMAVHALALSAMAWWFVLHGTTPRVAAATEAEIARHMPLPPPVPPPRPKRKRPPPPPPEPFDAVDPSHKDDSGEHDGHGTANRSTPGDRPMEAERGDEQADLAKTKPVDPALIDPAAARAAQSGRVTPDDALPLAPTPPRKGTYRPDFAAAADAANADPAGVMAKASARVLGPLPPSPTLAAPADDAPPAPSGIRESTVKASESVAPPPPSREVRGRQATASDTESVPFAKDATVEFHAGRMDARQGMNVQLFNPRWGLASENDLYAMGELSLVLGAHVRPDGSVSLVEVLKSSGSQNVDLDCERVVYAGVFEPRKDKDGHPMATLWTVVYH